MAGRNRRQKKYKFQYINVLDEYFGAKSTEEDIFSLFELILN